MIGSTVSIGLTNPAAANNAGSTVPITPVAFSAPVVMSPTCLSAIDGNVASYLGTPTIALLGQIVAELVSAGTSGTCQ